MQRGLLRNGGMCGILHALLFVRGVNKLESARFRSLIRSVFAVDAADFASSFFYLDFFTLLLVGCFLVRRRGFHARFFQKIGIRDFFWLTSDTPHPLPVFPFRRLFSLVCPFAFPRGPDRLM